MRDNIRTHLAIANQTRASTSAAIVNLHGFVAGANAIIWSSLIVAYISIGGGLPLFVFIGAAVSAIAVGLWRLYVQYLDNQIASLYPEIVLYEALLSVTPRLTGIRAHLTWNCPSLRGIFISNLSPEQQAQVVENLVNRRSIGHRGHWLFNVGAIFFILLLLFISVISVFYMKAPWTWYYTVSVVFIVIGLGLALCAWLHGQRNPDESTVSDLISQLTQQ